MNVVIDTNVIISGLLNPKGVSGQIINLILHEKLTLLFDNRILEEYREVLNRKKFGLHRNITDPLFDFIRNEGISDNRK
jgi:putative PIN family toxin of toxin-antitoxin system